MTNENMTLESDPEKGLNEEQVLKQRTLHGPNTIVDLKPTSSLKLVLDSIRQPMMLLLLSIVGISLVLGELIEASVMSFVVVAYVTVEFLNKRRTDRTLARLRELTQPTSRVIRDGVVKEIATGDVVMGDVIILSEGVRVPADVRLLVSIGLMINEALLTGESLPVRKYDEAQTIEKAQQADKTNFAFAGTTVLDGEGKAVVARALNGPFAGYSHFRATALNPS